MNSILLSTAYFGPVQYYCKLLRYELVYIEQFEHFNKQTYRNRCEILAANGTLPLIVPVVKGRGKKILIRDLMISYDTDWQRNHWRSIFSAYSSSPYFEYYCDDIIGFFEEKWKFLFDFNHEILLKMVELLEININIRLTDNFEKVQEGTLNFREALTPKAHRLVPDPEYVPATYTQVFSDNSWFIPNLSILDLLFNEGPNSVTIIEKSIVPAAPLNHNPDIS